MLAELVFFEHVGWGKGKESSDVELYNRITELTQGSAPQDAEIESLPTAVKLTSLSMFGFLITLLPSRWVHNLFTEYASFYTCTLG